VANLSDRRARKTRNALREMGVSYLFGSIGGTYMKDKLIADNAEAFDEVIAIIDNARESAFRAVNLVILGVLRFLYLKKYLNPGRLTRHHTGFQS
jgi:hypothetical protein